MTTLTSTDNLFTESIERLFASAFSPATLHDATQQGAGGAHWAQLEESGFLDVLLPESAGGAGLALAQAFPLFLSAGYHAVPLPYVQTALARAWLHAVGITAPRAPSPSPVWVRVRRAWRPCFRRTVGRVADWLLYAPATAPCCCPLLRPAKTAILAMAACWPICIGVLRPRRHLPRTRTPRSTLNPPYCAPPAWRRLWPVQPHAYWP